jgi:hypothetical protein
MIRITDYPLLVFVVSFLLLQSSALLGVTIVRKWWKPTAAGRADFGFVLSAILTLMGLIIGFSFSMAVNRYDQRKNLEEAEANAIGTEYMRADLLPAADAARVRELLKQYFAQRVLFYTARKPSQVREIDARTTQLQDELWSVTAAPAAASLQPSVALAVSGMNDVLNSQGYTQAAWWNRIPSGAWTLMVSIAAASCLLIGIGVHRGQTERKLLPVLPLVLSFAFFFIADIDSPRFGVIRVQPDNLRSIAPMFEAR